jgi:hypothetical protein
MPSLYEVSKLKLGVGGPRSFTHTVDDGIPLRKAALSIFTTFLEQLPGSLDIKPSCPLSRWVTLRIFSCMLIRLSFPYSHEATYLEASVETFVEPWTETMNKKAGCQDGHGTQSRLDQECASCHADFESIGRCHRHRLPVWQESPEQTQSSLTWWNPQLEQ